MRWLRTKTSGPLDAADGLLEGQLKGRQAVGLNPEAGGLDVPAQVLQVRCAGRKAGVQIDAGYPPGGAAPFVPLQGDQDHRPIVAVPSSGRRPPRSRLRASPSGRGPGSAVRAVSGRRRTIASMSARIRLFNLLAAGVQGVERLGELAGGVHPLRCQQLHGQAGVVEPAGGVQARAESEGHVLGFCGPVGNPAGLDQARPGPGRRRAADQFEARPWPGCGCPRAGGPCPRWCRAPPGRRASAGWARCGLPRNGFRADACAGRSTRQKATPTPARCLAGRTGSRGVWG